MRIIFMGTPEFGAIILQKLIDSSLKPLAVFSVLDKPKGRGLKTTPSPVKALALSENIPVFQPKKVKDLEKEIKKLKPDLIIVASYGQILPLEILNIPVFGCLNVHPSLLPKYRGSSPIQAAILNNDKQTGTTIMLMNEFLDQGPVLAQKTLDLSPQKANFQELHNALAKLSADLLIETIPFWLKKKIVVLPQNDKQASFTKAIKKEDTRINWKEDALEIEKKIRAFWPNVFTFWHIKEDNIKRVKILKASVLEQTQNGPFGLPGKTYLGSNEKIAVQTGKDFLLIEELQIEGKKPTKTSDFLKGNLDLIGKLFK